MKRNLNSGDVVIDTDGGSNKAIVVNRPPKTIAEWDVQGRGTVAEDNPQYSEDAQVTIVVYLSDFIRAFPYYAGGRPLPIRTLHGHGVNFYAFPEPRLEKVGEYGPHHVPLANVRPNEHHARSFDASENESFIEEIRERGELQRPVVVRPTATGFELINGHKRTWIASVVGFETIKVRALYQPKAELDRMFARCHFEHYTEQERQKASETLPDEITSEFQPEQPA